MTDQEVSRRSVLQKMGGWLAGSALIPAFLPDARAATARQAGRPDGSAIRHVTIARSDEQSPRNDTASIAELADGRLLVVWNKFSAGSATGRDFGPARIMSKTSSDGGLSWRQERLLVDLAPGDLNVQAPALGTLPNNELIMICLRAHSHSSSSMLTYRSVDGGQTFQPAKAIWERSQGQWLQGGTGSIVRLSTGRLIVPFHGGTGTQGKQHNVARCFISDDNGQSWRLTKEVIDLPMRGAMEASVAECADKQLVMSLRTQLGSVFVSRSTDGGETWALPQPAGLRSPESCTCLRRIPGTNRLVLFWNDSLYDPKHHHYGERTPLSAAVSEDGGHHWKKVGDLITDPGEYTNLNCTFTRSGTALLTYMANQVAFSAAPGMDLKLAIIPGSWFSA